MKGLEVNEINTYYGLSHVLFDVSLNVGGGEIIYYLGRNGAGKTTTITSIMGLTPPKRGSIKFKELRIENKAPFEICRLGIGWVPSGRRIFPDLTVIQNLEVVSRPGENRMDTWTAERVFSLFPGLSPLANHRGGQLSGGEKQMLAIGRTLMTNPELLVMDEPSEGLAPMIVREIKNIITHLKKSSFSILLVEQNLPMVLAVADYAYVLSKGIIVYQSIPNMLKENEEVKANYLGVATAGV